MEGFLNPLGISQSIFAKHLGGTWTQPKLSAIIRGKRAITEEIALDFADALGTSAEFWIGLQNDVHLWELSQGRNKIKPIKMQTARRTPRSKKHSRN